VGTGFDCGTHTGTASANNYYIVLVVVSFSSVFV
jgi:hypothetical protein